MLDSSDETGGTTKTRFWIEGSDGTNLSETMDILEDAGWSYKNPYSSANERTVYLTAENNNYNSESYTAIGRWIPQK